MCMDRFDPYFGGFAFGLAFFLTAFIFYFVVFYDRDQTGYEIMACMGNDHSRSKYEECRINVLSQRAR